MLPRLRKSGSELGWALVFELVLSVDMVLIEYVGYPLGYSINMLLVLDLDNSFETWEGSLVGVSLGPLDGLIIGTGEVYIVGLSQIIPLGSPFEYPNPGLTDIIIGLFLGNPIGSLLDYIWYIN